MGYSGNPRDPVTGRYLKKPIRLCKICFLPAVPGKFTAGGYNGNPPLCPQHKKEHKKKRNQLWERKRRQKRILWAFGLPGGEYTKCPYVHPTWPEHKELRRWKGWRMFKSKGWRTYYRRHAFEWRMQGLVDFDFPTDYTGPVGPVSRPNGTLESSSSLHQQGSK